MTDTEKSTLDNSNEKIQKTLKKFQSLADHVPVNSWGFEPEILDHLKEERTKIISKKIPKVQLLKMSKKEKQKAGVILGPKTNTVTEVIDWVQKTPLSIYFLF